MWPLPNKPKSFAAVAPAPAGFWHWLPSRCAICQDWPHAPLCEVCISNFAQPQNRCTCCALPWPHLGQLCPGCQNHTPPLDMCLAAVTYAWPWVELIAKFKFQQQVGWSHALATLMASTPFAEDLLDKADLVVPIPLSPQRLADRGYNQSWELAKQLSPLKAETRWLLRTRDTPSQRQLPRIDRLANLVGAFAVDPLKAPQIRGKRVVLVDDVMTSGASLHSAAFVLRQAGATHISALVLARTESRVPSASANQAVKTTKAQ